MDCQIHYLSAATESHWAVRGDHVEASTAQPGSAAVVVLDIADESHVVDTVPMVRGAGDGALLGRRRLAREFPGVALTTMLPVRKHRLQAVVDVVMVAADTAGKHSAALQSIAQQFCLRGVYTPALLVAEWLRCAGLERQQVLVVLPTPAGLRLVFVDRCRPLLSRLMPLIDGEAAAIEIGRTVQYLHNTQRVNRDVPVDVWFWGMEPALVEACLPASGSYRVAEAPIVARLADPARGGFLALLHLAATRPPNDQLAAQALRVGWHARVMRRVAQGVAAGLVLMGGVTAVLLAMSAASLRAATVSMRQESAQVAAAQAAIDASLQQQGLSLQQVLDMPEAATGLQKRQVSIREAVEVAGRIFGAQQQIQLSTVEFHSAPIADAAAADSTCVSDGTIALASLVAKFSVKENLNVRERSQAIAAVRGALIASKPWRAGAEQVALDQRTPLVAKAGSDAAMEAVEWTSCLLREAGA